MANNHRGTGPVPNRAPSIRMQMERLPDRPALVDSGSQRVGMVRQSPVSYQITFSREGATVQDDEGRTLAPKEKIAVATTILKDAQENIAQKDWRGPPVPVDEVGIEEGPSMEDMQNLDDRPPIHYTRGRGIPSSTDAVMKLSPLKTSPQFRGGPEMRLAPRVEDVELPRLQRKRGGTAKRKRHGSKIKKYAKGGGIRKAKYS